MALSKCCSLQDYYELNSELHHTVSTEFKLEREETTLKWTRHEALAFPSTVYKYAAPALAATSGLRGNHWGT